jgi:hypothetical protein
LQAALRTTVTAAALQRQLKKLSFQVSLNRVDNDDAVTTAGLLFLAYSGFASYSSTLN